MAEIDYESANELQDKLESANEWWPTWDTANRQTVSRWAALYEGDSDAVKSLANYTKNDYVVDPLPAKISNARADLIFGADPEFQSAEEDDQDRLNELVEENDLPSGLQRAHSAFVSAQGEVWWRIYIDETQADCPLVEWHSRLNVIPLWHGRTLMAVAFVNDICYDKAEGEKPAAVWRYIEIQSKGFSRNLLYRGTSNQLGGQVELTERPELADLEDEWLHGLDEILAGRVVNGYGASWALGRSDYHGVYDLLLALNQAVTIGQKNLQLTGKKRVVVPESYLDEKGRPPLDDDVIIASEAHRDPDKPTAGWAQLEWEFDADALIAYTRELVNMITTRVGLTSHFVDANSDDGLADSGTALRLRMLPASLSAEGVARYWDDALPKILRLLALVDSLALNSGGLGKPWKNTEDVPSVERSDPIPRDPVEDANLVTTLKNANLISTETSLEILHPDWSQEKREEEMKRIKKEKDENDPFKQGLFGGGSNGEQFRPQVKMPRPQLEPDAETS